MPHLWQRLTHKEAGTGQRGSAHTAVRTGKADEAQWPGAKDGRASPAGTLPELAEACVYQGAGAQASLGEWRGCKLRRTSSIQQVHLRTYQQTCSQKVQESESCLHTISGLKVSWSQMTAQKDLPDTVP